MFSQCIRLTTAPELPAMTLQPYCYEGMFSGNVRMVSGITLDVNTAGTAPDSCFKNMFKDCPAYLGDMCSTLHVNVGPNCYDNMFSYCESMPSAPYLPATTLDSQSYNQMFFRQLNL